MSIRHRWITWQVVVVGTLAADAVVAWRGSPIALVIAMTMLAAMLALLLTTPADAIVLPRGRSEVVISIGAIALFAASGFAGRDGRAGIGCIAFVTTVALLTLSRRLRFSAWWIAPLAWNPFLILALRNS